MPVKKYSAIFILVMPLSCLFAQQPDVVSNKVPNKATPSDLSDVRFADGCFKHAMDQDAAWLLYSLFLFKNNYA